MLRVRQGKPHIYFDGFWRVVSVIPAVYEDALYRNVAAYMFVNELNARRAPITT